MRTKYAYLISKRKKTVEAWQRWSRLYKSAVAHGYKSAADEMSPIADAGWRIINACSSELSAFLRTNRRIQKRKGNNGIDHH